MDKEETVIAVAAAKPARPPRPPPTLLGQIKCIDVIKYVSKFSMCLLFPSRLKGGSCSEKTVSGFVKHQFRVCVKVLAGLLPSQCMWDVLFLVYACLW